MTTLCGRWFFVLMFLFSLSACLHAEIYYGRVVRVADGDTLTILDLDNRQLKIRLAEIDAPELKQPYGTHSKETLSGLVAGKMVMVNAHDEDRYGRYLGRVYAEGQDINSALLRVGAAWVYRAYVQDKSLYAVEENAREQRRGLWRLPAAERVPPWEWRRREHAEKKLSR
jgi:endonuclease YncB( thermonuclease family)